MSNSSSHSFRAARFSAALLLGTGFASFGAPSAFAQSSGASTRSFSIAAQPLVDAMREFSRATGIQVVYTASVGSGVASAGVSGSLSSAEALSRLLTGTGLTYRFTGPNAVTLQLAPQTADGAVQLGPVRVEGANGGSVALLGSSVSDPTSTEGTGSYTIAATSVGTKSALSLREVPQSVTVITSQRIEDQALTTIHDVMNQATGITLFQGKMQESRYMSRGFEISSARVDGGSAIAVPSGESTDMFFYDHVEVLRGSDALFGGGGEPSGTINLVRKKPTNDLQVTGMVHAGSWNNYRVEADVAGPLALDGKLRGRVGAAYHDKDYFVRGADLKRTLAYAIIEADVTPDTLVRIGANYDHNHASTQGYGLPRYDDGSDLKLPRRTFLSGADDMYNRKTWSIFGHVDQRLPADWKLTLDANIERATSSRDTYFFSGAISRLTDAGSGNAPWARNNEKQHNASIDAIMTGSLHLFGRSHDIILGGTWQRFTGSTLNYRSTSAPAAYIPDIRTFDPNDYRTPTDTYLFLKVPEFSNTNKGVYGSIRINPSDKVKLTAGARLSWYGYLSGLNMYNTAGTETYSSLVAYKNKGIFTPYLAATYDLADDWTAYASFAETFKSQANMLEGPLPGTPLDPVTGRTMEVGVKGTVAQGRLNMALSLYRTDRNGQAVQDPTYPSTPGNLGSNCCYLAQGLIRSQGVDAEISGEIVKGWNLTAGYTFNDNRNRVADQRYEMLTPRHLLKLFTSYRLDGGGLNGLTVGGGIQAQTRSSVRETVNVRDANGSLTGETINAEFSQGAYVLANLFTRYDINDNLNISANLNNVFDKTYYSTIGYTYYGNFYGEPRNFLVTIRTKY